ncbi:MAG: FAD-dependent oxidoreductase, partial [Muribaculaceae bacterium]|nr:FAD-dependent oxidoreductase [Muribaculaceae bacterium]
MAETNARVLIIGSGPAGYTAAIYASRANLHPLVYEGNQPGGQLTQTTEIENFPGYPDGVQGQQMMEEFRQQSLRFGAEIRPKTISKVDFSSRPFLWEDEDGDVVVTETVIIA